jgi:hypothetical protein
LHCHVRQGWACETRGSKHRRPPNDHDFIIVTFSERRCDITLILSENVTCRGPSDLLCESQVGDGSPHPSVTEWCLWACATNHMALCLTRRNHAMCDKRLAPSSTNCIACFKCSSNTLRQLHDTFHTLDTFVTIH